MQHRLQQGRLVSLWEAFWKACWPIRIYLEENSRLREVRDCGFCQNNRLRGKPRDVYCAILFTPKGFGSSWWASNPIFQLIRHKTCQEKDRRLNQRRFRHWLSPVSGRKKYECIILWEWRQSISALTRQHARTLWNMDELEVLSCMQPRPSGAFHQKPLKCGL